jgi:hypothetical protein
MRISCSHYVLRHLLIAADIDSVTIRSDLYYILYFKMGWGHMRISDVVDRDICFYSQYMRPIIYILHCGPWWTGEIRFY